MAIPETNHRKIQLRKVMRQTLAEASQDSSRALASLDQWLAMHPESQVIAAFSTLPGEVDLSESIARHPDRTWVYPKVAGEHHLTFHIVENPHRDLMPGAFGILEPVSSTPEMAVTQIDAFLCPGIAFDPRGGRLGRGRGFYDRILSAARPEALKIGICFPHQLVEDTFSEPHDIHMDAVIS